MDAIYKYIYLAIAMLEVLVVYFVIIILYEYSQIYADIYVHKSVYFISALLGFAFGILYKQMVAAEQE